MSFTWLKKGLDFDEIRGDKKKFSVPLVKRPGLVPLELDPNEMPHNCEDAF